MEKWEKNALVTVELLDKYMGDWSIRGSFLGVNFCKFNVRELQLSDIISFSELTHSKKKQDNNSM